MSYGGAYQGGGYGGGGYGQQQQPSYGGRPGQQGGSYPPQQQYQQSGYPPQAGGFDDQLRSWFAAVDRDGSDSISPIELKQALVNGNFESFSDETIKLLFNMFDQDRSGHIGFQEFAGLYKYIQEWQGVFRRFDNDASGYINGSELQNAISAFGFSVSPKIIGILERKYGGFIQPGQRGGSGINFDRFVRCCVSVRALTEAFMREDVQRTGHATLSYDKFLEMVLSAP